MQLFKSHLTKLAQGKEMFQICTEADSPGPSFPGTRYSVGVVQTCCLSIQPEIPFYLVSLACFLSKKSLEVLKTIQTIGSQTQVYIQLSWKIHVFDRCQVENLYFEHSLGDASDPATVL